LEVSARILDLGGAISKLAQVTQQVAAAGNSRAGSRAVLRFTANDPQILVTIDRDRARSLGLPIREVTDALAVLLGSQYVNDFDFNQRAYRVYVQGDRQFRAEPQDLSQYYARASNGDMVPLSTVVRLQETTAPAVSTTSTSSARPKSPALPCPASARAALRRWSGSRANAAAGYDFAGRLSPKRSSGAGAYFSCCRSSWSNSSWRRSKAGFAVHHPAWCARGVCALSAQLIRGSRTTCSVRSGW
jgi:hypothetical protein